MTDAEINARVCDAPFVDSYPPESNLLLPFLFFLKSRLTLVLHEHTSVRGPRNATTPGSMQNLLQELERGAGAPLPWPSHGVQDFPHRGSGGSGVPHPTHTSHAKNSLAYLVYRTVTYLKVIPWTPIFFFLTWDVEDMWDTSILI